MPSKEFGKYVKGIRTKNNMTLQELGDKTGFTKSYLSIIENGKQGIPRPETIDRISRGLDFSYNELMKVAGYIKGEWKMDLQHPAITQTLKTGYPDNAGKPTNKIHFDPNCNRGREDYQMDILSDLVKTCIDNDLKIDISGEIGIASIYDLRGDRAEIVSEGYIKNWEHESPQDTLERMTDELNDYLRGGYNE